MSYGKRVLGMLLTVILITASGVVYGADIPAVRGREGQIPQLMRDVRMLETINQLDLTKEQIEKILPILRRAKEMATSVEEGIEKALQARREALLKGEDVKVDLEEFRHTSAIRAQELKVSWENVKLQLMKILTPAQLKKVEKLLSPIAEQRMMGWAAISGGVMRGIQEKGNLGGLQRADMAEKDTIDIKKDAIRERVDMESQTKASEGAAKKETSPADTSAVRPARPTLKDKILEKVKDFKNLSPEEKMEVLKKVRAERQRNAGSWLGIAPRVPQRMGGSQVLDDLIRLLEEKLKVLAEKTKREEARNVTDKAPVPAGEGR